MATLKITGVDEATAHFVAERSRALHFNGQAEYLRSLIREDMGRAKSERTKRLAALVGPLHRDAAGTGVTGQEVAAVVEEARNEVARDRARRR